MPDVQIEQMTPEKAEDVLGKMQGQLEDVIAHFKRQADVSSDTKAKTLPLMYDQLEALKHGRAALTYAIQTGVAVKQTDTVQ